VTCTATFDHEALLYEGTDGFLAGTLPFLREGIEQDDAMLVAVSAERIAALRDELGSGADDVRFVDMAELGVNPGRIIPAWAAFVNARPPGRALRGIGEPIWASRTTAELVECQLHESLLNVAFAGVDDFRLLCPYDVSVLDDCVVHEARCSHPVVVVPDGVREPSRQYRSGDDLLAPFDAPLPKPPTGRTDLLAFEGETLDQVRGLVVATAERAGLGPRRAADLVLAVNELAANSVRHGGGNGVLRIWCEDDSLVCEVKDRGNAGDPLVGRRQPPPDRDGGWGVWIAHQVCDLVQFRSGRGGTVARVRMRAGDAA
jgi:anti-sigma regulatory factor (Ser/Thr protein kinase)